MDAAGTSSRRYIAIDLKSFYASVECVDRGFNPLTTNLVVADVSRTEKTICLEKWDGSAIRFLHKRQ